jgi:hypothetical protein
MGGYDIIRGAVEENPGSYKITSNAENPTENKKIVIYTYLLNRILT